MAARFLSKVKRLEGSDIANIRAGIAKIYQMTAGEIKGNARVCVFLEPLFGITLSMYGGYMTLYMLALGLTKTQIGMVTSVGMVFPIFFALISAFVTDKMGRKYSLLVFDIIGWTVPHIFWAFARDIRFFIIATVFHAFFRVAFNSWYCLVLEDSPPDSRIQIFNFIQIAGLIAGLFTPIGALLVNRFSVIPAVRIMMVVNIFTVTFLIVFRHFFVTETDIGRQRMQEMKHADIGSALAIYAPIIRKIFRNKTLILVLLIYTFHFIQLTIRGTFLAVLITERLGFPAESMAIFSVFNSVVMFFVLFLISPLLNKITRRWPIALGVICQAMAAGLLLLSPATQNYLLLLLSAILMALGTGVASPRIETLLANAIENEERSVANSLMNVFLLLFSAPFGYISGVLSERDVRLPFVLMFVFFGLCLGLLWLALALERKGKE